VEGTNGGDRAAVLGKGPSIYDFHMEGKGGHAQATKEGGCGCPHKIRAQ